MDLNAIAVFTHVVRAGSFSGAARILGIPKSTASLRVSQLERRLGVGLLTRTTRKLQLTEAGRTYYETCARVLSELESVEGSLTEGQAKPHGLLRITAGLEGGVGLVGDLVAGFLERHGDVRVDLRLSSQRVDLIAEDVDVAIRAGHLEDSTLKARRLGASIFKVFASPRYLRTHPAPRHPLDLKAHDCLCLTTAPRADTVIELRRGAERVRVPVRARFVSNQISAVRHQALAGGGVACLPMHFCADEVRRRALVALLPDWSSEGVPIHIVYPPHRFVTPKVRAFVDYVAETVRPDAWGLARSRNARGGRAR